MLLSQEPVNLYMTCALISFGVTSLSEKYCPILKDLRDGPFDIQGRGGLGFF